MVVMGVVDGWPQCGDLRDGGLHGGSLLCHLQHHDHDVYHCDHHQGREGLGGGVPPNHMWTPYGFVPFQMGAAGQQVITLVFERFCKIWPQNSQTHQLRVQ